LPIQRFRDDAGPLERALFAANARVWINEAEGLAVSAKDGGAIAFVSVAKDSFVEDLALAMRERAIIQQLRLVRHPNFSL
jgi:hypothetical protein